MKRGGFLLDLRKFPRIQPGVLLCFTLSTAHDILRQLWWEQRNSLGIGMEILEYLIICPVSNLNTASSLSMYYRDSTNILLQFLLKV